MQQRIALVSVIAVLLLFGVLLFSNRKLSTSDGALAGNPEDYIGKDISLSGEVEKLQGTHAFVVDSPGVFGEEVLIISRQPVEPIGGSGNSTGEENRRVSVEGQVRTLNFNELQETMGLTLNEDYYKGWEGKPVIIAESIEEQ